MNNVIAIERGITRYDQVRNQREMVAYLRHNSKQIYKELVDYYQQLETMSATMTEDELLIAQHYMDIRAEQVADLARYINRLL